jgi:O-antigen/teichoic acid export membrane protein
MGRATGDSPAESTFVARLAVAGSVLACGFLAAIAVVAVPFVFGRPFAPAVAPTIILCGATVFYTLMMLLTAVLLAEGHARWSSTALVAGSLVTLGGIFGLATFGAVGAAFASLGGYTTSVIIAALALSRTGTPYTLRMLAVPYPKDFTVAWRKLARLRRQPASRDAG